jgi:hypothetical protein
MMFLQKLRGEEQTMTTATNYQDEVNGRLTQLLLRDPLYQRFREKTASWGKQWTEAEAKGWRDLGNDVREKWQLRMQSRSRKFGQ